MAAVLVAWHAVWAALVALGVAQTVYDFAFRLHFLQSETVVGPFEPATAGGLLLAAAGVGYAMGATLALVWNCLTAVSEAAATRRTGEHGLGRTGRPARSP